MPGARSLRRCARTRRPRAEAVQPADTIRSRAAASLRRTISVLAAQLATRRASPMRTHPPAPPGRRPPGLTAVLPAADVDLGPFNKLKLLRAFRIFRLFKRIKSLNKIIVAIGRSIPGVMNALLIMVRTSAVDRRPRTSRLRPTTRRPPATHAHARTQPSPPPSRVPTPSSPSDRFPTRTRTPNPHPRPHPHPRTHMITRTHHPHPSPSRSSSSFASTRSWLSTSSATLATWTAPT